MQFHIISGWPPDSGKDSIYLTIDNWNDYGFVTSFGVYAFDQTGTRHDLPSVRIGFIGQTTETDTYQKLEGAFERLPGGFFSLGMGVDYYQQLFSSFDPEWREEFLSRLRDVVWDEQILEQAVDEQVFRTSHLRNIDLTQIKDQFASVLSGDVRLTDYDFGFDLPQAEKFAGFDLTFSVTANSTPSTNMHALIGRNGVGKTTLLNGMVKAIASTGETDAHFYRTTPFGAKQALDESYFTSLVSVAFSAFDPFDLPAEDGSGRYSYIGMTDLSDGDEGAIIKSKSEVLNEFIAALGYCFNDDRRKNRWIQAIGTLQSDANFAEMDLLVLSNLDDNELEERTRYLFGKMSSGHSIVILTMTLLVSKVEERTLVLFDEPESHLHPPLLSALIRSLSQLLHARNAVAIIATHSPVVLQEIPRSCVWKVFRSRLASEKKRPDTETFGENVGILTREVFGLEVEKSGYHTVLSDLVDRGGDYEKILDTLGGNVGDEARGILRAMTVNRDEKPN